MPRLDRGFSSHNFDIEISSLKPVLVGSLYLLWLTFANARLDNDNFVSDIFSLKPVLVELALSFYWVGFGDENLGSDIPKISESQ